MIFCDELRQDALGCYGNPAGPMRTPHMDSLAETGTLFENCFCNSPVCVPSRTSLITGLYPEDTAVYDNEAAYPGYTLEKVPVSFPEVLAQNGWHTASFGKTHLPPELQPFEINREAGGEMTLGLSREEAKALPRISPRGAFSFNAASLYPEGKDYYPEIVTKNALDWIGGQTEPFFVRVSYMQPHSPIIVKRGYEKVYEDLPFSGRLPDISGLSEFERSFAAIIALDTLSEEEIVQIKRYYYGMVAWIDGEVGKILAFLRARGLADNTIVMLSADHGALRGECRGLGKHIFNRASQAVPLIFFVPGREGGVRRTELCSNIDIARTVFGLLGVEAPAQFKGVDLFSAHGEEPVFSTIGYGESFSHAFPNRKLGAAPGKQGWPRRACIRRGPYRLDLNTRLDGLPPQNAEEEDLFFVDCRVCPAEDRNMAGDSAYADIVPELRSDLLAHTAGARETDPSMLHMLEKMARAREAIQAVQ